MMTLAIELFPGQISDERFGLFFDAVILDPFDDASFDRGNLIA